MGDGSAKKTQSSEGIVKVICCQVVLGRVFRLFLIQMSVAFAAGRAKSGFTAMRDFHALGTRWADKQMVAEERCSANEQFQNVDDNTEPNKVVVL